MILSQKLYKLHNGDAVLVIHKPTRDLYIYLRARRPEQRRLFK